MYIPEIVGGSSQGPVTSMSGSKLNPSDLSLEGWLLLLSYWLTPIFQVKGKGCNDSALLLVDPPFILGLPAGFPRKGSLCSLLMQRKQGLP